MKKLIKVIEKTGFEIVDKRKATNTSSYYLTVAYEGREFAIRYADHADCYASSDINVAVPNSDNVDGISLSRLEEKLNEIVAIIDNEIVEEELNDTNDYRATTEIQFDIMYNIDKINHKLSIKEFNATDASQLKFYFEDLERESDEAIEKAKNAIQNANANSEIEKIRINFMRVINEKNIMVQGNKIKYGNKMYNFSFGKNGLRIKQQNRVLVISNPNELK